MSVVGDIVDFLAKPEIRAVATLFSLISVGVSVWALRKTYAVLHTHEQDIFVRQSQVLDGQWLAMNWAMVQNESALQAAADILGTNDTKTLRRHSFFQLLVNMLAFAFESMSRGILSETHYVNHFSSAALYFKNNLSDFLFYARDGEYSQEFLQDCKERFSKLDPMSAQELHDRFFPPNGLPGDA